MFSYADGKFVQTGALGLPFAKDTIGTLRGFRIFTACRTLGGKVFRLEDHIERLFNSAQAICMKLPHKRNQLKKVIQETADKNQRKQQDLLLEIIYSGGQAASNGISPSGPAVLYIAVFPLKLPPKRWYQEGIKLATYPYQRQWAEVKLLNYVGAVIAHETVVKKYRADEALFVSPDNKKTILEGTTFNFFIVRGDALVTHPLDGRILPGITRKVTLELARQQDIAVRENCFSYSELKKADEAFITSSTRNVVPVIRVDRIVIGNGAPGKMTRALGKAFEEYQLSLRGATTLRNLVSHGKLSF